MSLLEILLALTKFGLGFMEDLLDERDLKMRDYLGAAPMPTEGGVRWAGFQRRVQVGQSCTGFAVQHAVQATSIHHGFPAEALSGLFNYYTGRVIWDAQGHDQGSFNRHGLKAVARWGLASEAAWPTSATKINTGPNWAALQDASPRRSIQYFAIEPGDIDTAKRAVVSGHALVGGWTVNRGVFSWDSRFPLQPMENDGTGKHAMCVLAYDRYGTWFGPNSWPDKWGRNGYWIGSTDFMKSARSLWAVRRIR